MLPDGATWSFPLDDEVPWLEGVPIAPVEGASPWPDERVSGKSFVSFRFWRTSRPVDPPSGIDSLSEVFKRVMPDGGPEWTRIGVVGLDDLPEDAAKAFQDAVEASEDDSDGDESQFGQFTHDVTIVEAVTPLLTSSRQSDVLEALQRVMGSFSEFCRIYRLATKNH